MFVFSLAEVSNAPQKPCSFANYDKYYWVWNFSYPPATTMSDLFWTSMNGMGCSLLASELSSTNFFHFKVYIKVSSSVAEHTITQPKAPLKYILETALNLSCPAMSHNCRRAFLPSIVVLSLVEKSHPIVDFTYSSNL